MPETLVKQDSAGSLSSRPLLPEPAEVLPGAFPAPDDRSVNHRANSASSSPQDHVHPALQEQDPDAVAEREFGMYGGDAPQPPEENKVFSSGRAPLPGENHDAGEKASEGPRGEGDVVVTKLGGPDGEQRGGHPTVRSDGPPSPCHTDAASLDGRRARPRAHSASSLRSCPPASSSPTPTLSGSTTLDPQPPRKPMGDGEAEDPNKITWADQDPDNPQNMGRRRKWWLTMVCALLTINVTFASSAPSAATLAIAAEFGVSQEAAVLVTSLFLCGYVGGPILWAPASELFGRRPVFLFTMLAYTLFELGDALGKTFETVLVTRFFAGLFASAPLTNCGGVIADIWDPIGRGPAMSAFSASVFLGPVLGPIVGGFVTESSLGWRWVFWIITIWAGASWVLIACFLPETFAPILLAERARKLRRSDPEKHADLYAEHEKADFSFKGIVSRTLTRPLVMLATEPILLLVTLYLSIVYGLLYALFEAFPIIWQELRGFSMGTGGLIFIGVGIGTTFGSVLNIRLQRHYRWLSLKWHGHPPAEERLPGAMVAGPFLVVGIFWLGWTGAYPSIPWWVPALSTVLIGISFTLVFISFMTYLIDVYLMYSASALAANTICRSALGAAFPLFTRQLFTGLGVQWAATLIGCLALLILPSPYIFYRYGPRIRTASRFAPALDLQIKEQVEREEREATRGGLGGPPEHPGGGGLFARLRAPAAKGGKV